MFTTLLLGCVYWFLGFVAAILAGSGIGLFLCAVIALFRLFSYKWTWALLLMYAVGAVVCGTLIQLILFTSGEIGDRTNYKGQGGLIVGAVFPGILMLGIVPQFIATALRQTGGNPSE